MSDLPDYHAAIPAFMARFHRVVIDFNDNLAIIANAQRTIDETNVRQGALIADADKLRASAQLLGFNLDEEYQRWAQMQQHQQDWVIEAEAIEPSAPAATAAPATPEFNMTVREFILQEAKTASPVRAAALRKKLAEVHGQHVHEKTIGMTLYRMSKEEPPTMRRVGKQDWYYVRPEEADPPASVLFE